MPDFSFKRIYANYNLQLFLSSGLLTLSSTNFGEFDLSQWLITHANVSSSSTSGFDNAGFGQVQAMNAFVRDMGYPCTPKQCKLPSKFLSFLNGRLILL